VDRLRERRDLALRFEDEFLAEVTVGDRGDDLDDAAHLLGEVRGHDVDVVGQVLPRAADAFDLRLTAKLSFGPDLLRDARDLRCERVQLIYHLVDDVRDLEDLPLDVDGDLLAEVAIGDGGRHLGDVAQLNGEVGRHRVDVVGKVLPRAVDAFDVG